MTMPLTARRPWMIAPLLCAVLLSGCSQDGLADAASPTPTPTAAPSTTPQAPPAEAGPAAPADDGGPEASFRTWLAASRAPDAATACAYMTPALAQRMVDEIGAVFPGVTDCPSMIEATAAFYAAAGQSSETVVELREETADRAVLHVTYSAGSCGLVVLQPGDGHWVLDERSDETC
ncbi:hypothetical protein [Cellulomonas xiejunii]|uniref:hypothetical protein n=1 Tax=Cellulomonas xiejunii TaxID=2968083 RepID=UPI001D0F12FD|nr:hypothetical protein [Cellulomonas xiejunii]MCC2315215.1 hypothetical protein [Cellulomonas xiejunii]